MYVAKTTIKVQGIDGKVRIAKPGDEIPEAFAWRNVDAYIREGRIELKQKREVRRNSDKLRAEIIKQTQDHDAKVKKINKERDERLADAKRKADIEAVKKLKEQEAASAKEKAELAKKLKEEADAFEKEDAKLNDEAEKLAKEEAELEAKEKAEAEKLAKEEAELEAKEKAKDEDTARVENVRTEERLKSMSIEDLKKVASDLKVSTKGNKLKLIESILSAKS